MVCKIKFQSFLFLPFSESKRQRKLETLLPRQRFPQIPTLNKLIDATVMKPTSSSSSATIQALLHLSYESEHKHKDIPATIKLLETLLQSGIPLLPLQEIEARLRLSSLLLTHTHNLTHAKSHLERAHFLLSQIPSSTHLKLKAHSLLAHCYYLIGSIPQQKLVLLKGLALLDDEMGLDDEEERVTWGVGMRAQLGAGMAVEGDYDGAARELEKAVEMVTGWVDGRWTELRMLFAAMVLHVRMLWWEDEDEVREAARRCEEIWDGLDDEKKQQCVGLFFYHELLQTFYLLRICDYKIASQHVDRLDAAMKADLQKVQIIKELNQELDSVNQSLSKTNLQRKHISALSQKKEELEEQFKEATGFDPSDYHICSEDKLFLAPPPLDGEWLPKSAVYALVDLMTVMLGRPKGVFKECGKRIQSGLNLIHDELTKLGIKNGTTEVDLQHSAIWMAGLYLMLLMQFLENKVAVELTRSEFVEAQQALVQMRDWFIRFPTILQGCECTIEMLRGQYAHSVGCFHEAAFHFLEATKLTESKSMQSMCQVYAAVSYICIGDADSSAQALELVGPVYKIVDSFIGVREKTCIVFAYGLLLMRQHKLQEARIRLASGLKIAHQQLGNIQLVSQYLTILGTLALQLHDIGQAREILKSSLTLAKTLYDVPTQIWVVSVLSALYQEVGERENEMENSEYERKKEEDLQKRLSGAHSHVHHFELIEKARIEVKQLHGLDIKRAIAGPSNKVDLDIPESIGLPTLIPSVAFSSRLRDSDSVKRGKRKI